MRTTAVVLSQPRHIGLTSLDLEPAAPGDVTVAVDWSGISTGTERLLYDGRMPAFPGMGYPLVPGYEAVGRVVASRESALAVGQTVFVPGANCYRGARGLFGAAASHLVVPASRVVPVAAELGDRAVLLALAATAYHALDLGGPAVARVPDLVVGHGTLGRLLARIVVAIGGPAPTVWEVDHRRRGGEVGYEVVDPSEDPRRDYRAICDASGAADLLDVLIGHLAPGGELCLAGFYSQPLSFAFPPAFMREIRLRVAAQWKPADLAAVVDLVASGALSLDGLLTHAAQAQDAPEAYATAFRDPDCLKMVLDWRRLS